MCELYLKDGASALSNNMCKELGINKDEWESAKTAFRPALHWFKTTNLTRPDQEVSLISNEHGFGGTFDCLYKGPDGLIVCDWKTSKVTTISNLYQLASYGILVEEHYEEPVTGYYLVRFDKEAGTFEHYYYPDLEEEKSIFLDTLKLHERIKENKKARKL